MPVLIANRKSQIAKLILLISIFALLTSHLSGTLAQTLTSKKAQEDYLFQFGKTQESHEKYVVARSSYLTFKTAISKNEAFLKTKDYLLSIDQLLLTYVDLVKEQSILFDWTGSEKDRDETIKNLTDEAVFYKNHQQKINAAQTLEELPPLAQEIKIRKEKVTLPLVYKSLATYEAAAAQSATFEFKQLAQQLEDLTSLKLKLAENASFYANWTSEIQNIATNASSANQEAKEILTNKPPGSINEGDLTNIMRSVKKTQTELERSKLLFEEIRGLL